eukprot:GHRQ01003030.1.p1 GENE.GHRQ01003030.1~~GHRQ01003030.1.p1  ORF type:complete len:353 (+),score=131.66 GHRQ01003030.1:772-1830(+)
MDGPSLAEALFCKKAEEVWQDREVRFDVAAAQLQCRRGEEVLDTFEPVEDTKGNNGDGGRLTLTHLRLMWRSTKQARTSISMGLDAISSIAVRPVSSRLKGNADALYIMARQNQQRFEFIFTDLTDRQPGLAAGLQALVAAYEASRPYRELRLRGALLVDKELKLLPREVAYSRVDGVSNLSSETGNLGALYLTNVRMVWHSKMAASFNVSIPYLQIKHVRIADSKFGLALVVETSAASGGYVLGFRVDPKETLEYVHKEMSSLLQAYANCPLFGVEYDVNAGAESQAVKPLEGDADVLEPEGAKADAWAAYYADGASGGGAGCEPVFSAELGLAVEAPRDGASIQQLWSIL